MAEVRRKGGQHIGGGGSKNREDKSKMTISAAESAWRHGNFDEKLILYRSFLENIISSQQHPDDSLLLPK